MKVTFWSPTHGQCCSTTNMLATSVICAKEDMNCLVTHSQLKHNNFESFLLGKDNEKKELFDGIGMDELLRLSNSKELDKEDIHNSTITILNRLSLLPGTAQIDRASYELKMMDLSKDIFDSIDKFYDITFLDVNSGHSELTDYLLKESDLVVVSLNQNLSVIRSFFEQMKAKQINKNMIYLFSNYNSNSRYNLKNLKRNFAFLNSKNTAFIPHNYSYADALNEGNITKFITRYYEENSNTNNDYFIHQLKNAANIIMDKVTDLYEAKGVTDEVS